MTRTQNLVTMAAKLYEMRDTARTLHGDKYPEVVRQWGAALVEIEKIEGGGVLSAAIAASKRTDKPHTVMMLMAAAVEMVEPDDQTPSGLSKDGRDGR